MKGHQELLTAAIERDGKGQAALLAGDPDRAREELGAAAELYQRSWEAAPRRSYGRLVGMLKAVVLAADGERQAAKYVEAALEDDPEASGSPTAGYALALAALIIGDDHEARAHTEAMHGASDAFDRAASAIAALADRDRERYAAAVRAIVGDFEQRSAHLTGVAIADTALVLERLAAARGVTAGVRSELLPV